MTTAPNPDDRSQSDPTSWVDRYGDILYRYALLRVRRRELAEDLVQETLLAALRAKERFSGKSSEKTWLIGILRHKITDHFRKISRSRVEELDVDSGPEFFLQDGRWSGKLRKWPSDPQQAMESREFWQVFEQCWSKLPSAVANVFALTEIDRQERAQVCEQLQITRSNLSVRLHRAKLLLQRCLHLNWFSSKD